MLKSVAVETHMKSINLICGVMEPDARPFPLFHKATMEFLDEVSKTILNTDSYRNYPDLVSIAFWCRKSSLERLKQQYPDACERMGRGISFHITPSNIPVNFAFSWIFSLLAGNANIVRLPSKYYPQNMKFCSLVSDLMEKYSHIKNSNSLIQYERTDDITTNFSKIADVRMIWGGDATVSHIRKMPSKPSCIDLVFVDRFSMAIIDGAKVLSITENEIKVLAKNFFNDTYLMDQNACSSPQIILWINDTEQAREKFWSAVNKNLHDYTLHPASAVDKLVLLHREIIENEILENCKINNELIYRINLNKLNSNIINWKGNCGYFHEYALENIFELLSIISDKYQTLTYFGINPEDIRKLLMEHRVSGIDRIVPIGKAMSIEPVWDGHDILRETSRKISIE